MKFTLPKKAPATTAFTKPTVPTASVSQSVGVVAKSSRPAKHFNPISSIKNIWHSTTRLISFIILLIAYQIFRQLIPWRIIPERFCGPLQLRMNHYLSLFAKLLGGNTKQTISHIDLIELSFRNMQAKKTRTLITVGGMSIGVGAIVFLVSIGYGLQQLVIARVARLDEMRQADVFSQTGSTVKINDKTLSALKEVPKVEQVLPQITAVGRVNYQNSISDMAVFGVTADYLNQSAIKPIKGRIFQSNDISYVLPKGQVAGASTTYEPKDAAYGQEIAPVNYVFGQDEWVRVREKPDSHSKIIGYSRRVEGTSSGKEVWGHNYVDNQGDIAKDKNGQQLGKWIFANVGVWTNTPCEGGPPACEDKKYVPIKDANGAPVYKEGYLAEINVKTVDTTESYPQVLGITTNSEASDSAAASSSAEGTTDLGAYVEIASLSAQTENRDIRKMSLNSSSVKEAIVNRATLKVLGIDESEAVGKTFQTSFIITGNLLANNDDRVESNPASYTIIGVTPDDKTPVFFVPFLDLRQLDIVNYSQVKIVAKNPEELPKVRRQIEAQGYLTSSVADTVNQINALFATLRAVLLLIGTVALAVAALGMFNTLTISLLERTREVGLMKAMGMKSSEVRELFLTESMIMGFYGGVCGIIFGFLSGKLLSMIISFFAVVKGVGFIDIAYLPPTFLIVILVLSLVVGIITGIYPAYRTTKISALNALRYE
jgi:ABC-type antimicrobial peptide transport system permease subunit